jgi:hypothetical protein
VQHARASGDPAVRPASPGRTEVRADAAADAAGACRARRVIEPLLPDAPESLAVDIELALSDLSPKAKSFSITGGIEFGVNVITYTYTMD